MGISIFTSVINNKSVKSGGGFHAILNMGI